MTDEANKIVYALECCEQDRNCFECGSRCPYDGIGSHCDEKLMADAADLIERLTAGLEQVKRERDAAITHMEYIVYGDNPCMYCKKEHNCDGDFLHGAADDKCSVFVWRGVCAENSGGDEE